jgi:hypothetical protein
MDYLGNSKRRNVAMKRAIVFSLLLLVLGSEARNQTASRVSPVFQAGEELRYKVKWNFLRLGTVTIRTLHDSLCTAPEEYRILMIVESNPDLSFIWIREFNESMMDARSLSSRQFRAKHRNGDQLTCIQHSYDGTTRMAISRVEDGNSGTIIRSDTLRNVSPFVEGPSLFLAARCLCRLGNSLNVPTMVGETIAPTDLSFPCRPEEMDVDALGGPVRVCRFDGVAHWNGGTEAGLSGEFSGWVSDDAAAVPVKAEMKVLLGSICLELESWSRPGWVPPTGLRASNQ